MEPEHIIDETVTMKGTSIEKVYDDCIEWLRTKKANITKQNSPTTIEAILQEKILGYRSSITTETVKLQLSQDKSSFPSLFPDNHAVIVKFRMDSWTVLGLKQFPQKMWIQYVEELWRFLKIPLDDDSLRRLYPLSRLHSITGRYRGYTIIGFLLCGGFGITMINALFHTIDRGMFYIFTFSAFILLCIYGLNDTWNYYFMKYQKFRSLEDQLYPDR